jgi:hypothetical protein
MYSSKPWHVAGKMEQTQVTNRQKPSLAKIQTNGIPLHHKRNGVHEHYSPKCGLPLVSLIAQTATLECAPAATQKMQVNTPATMPQYLFTTFRHTIQYFRDVKATLNQLTFCKNLKIRLIGCVMTF